MWNNGYLSEADRIKYGSGTNEVRRLGHYKISKWIYLQSSVRHACCG